MKRFSMHLTTRCGCTRTIDIGSTPPPPDWNVPLEPTAEQKRQRVEALNLAGAAPDELREPVPTRRFVKTGYSGTQDFGTAFYKEV